MEFEGHSKLLVVVVISVLVSVMIIGSAVYFWQKLVSEKAISSLEQKVTSLEKQLSTINQAKETPQPTSLPELSPVPITDQTENWLAYSNSNIVYTFKYPRNISLTEGNEGPTIQLSSWGQTQERDTEFYDGILLYFSLPFQIGDIPLSEYVDREIEKSKQNADILKQKSKINVNEIEGYTYTVRGLGISEYTYLQSPDKIWTVEIINATNDPTNQGYDSTVNQILSTFEFIN